MIEVTIKNFIEENLDYPAYMEIPTSSPPDIFFVIEKISGSREDLLYSSTLAIQTYAPSMYETALACEEMTNKILDSLTECPEVTGVELNSSYNHPDTSTKRYRYQSLFEIFYYGGNE